MRVSRTLYKGEHGPPKSRYGVRTILLTAPLVPALRLHRLATGVPPASAPLFALSLGTSRSLVIDEPWSQVGRVLARMIA